MLFVRSEESLSPFHDSYWLAASLQKSLQLLTFLIGQTDQVAYVHPSLTVLETNEPELRDDGQNMAEFTDKQGQYLAFIHAYTKIHRQPPAEADMQRYFQVTPPTVHRMVLELERRQLITREPRRARTIKVLIRPEELPVLR